MESLLYSGVTKLVSSPEVQYLGVVKYQWKAIATLSIITINFRSNYLAIYLCTHMPLHTHMLTHTDVSVHVTVHTCNTLVVYSQVT